MNTKTSLSVLLLALVAVAAVVEAELFTLPFDGLYQAPAPDQIEQFFPVLPEDNSPVHESNIRVQPRGNDAYTLAFTNRDDTVYRFPYLTNEQGRFKYGDNDKDLVFIEAQFAEDMTVEQARQAKNLFNIGVLDYFVLSHTDSGQPSDAVTHVVRYNSIDVADRTLSFDEEGSGTKEFTYEPLDLAHGAVLGKARLVFGGNAYTAYIGNGTQHENDYPLAIDMNGDGFLNRAEVVLTNRAGSTIDLGTAEESDGGSFTYVPSEGRFTWNNQGDSLSSGITFLSLFTPANIYRNSPRQNEHVTVVFEQRKTDQLGIAYVKGSNFVLEASRGGGKFISDYAVAFALGVHCCGDAETFVVAYLPPIQIVGKPIIGKTINITLTDPAYPLTPAVLMMALGTEPGYTLDDGRVIPLNSTEHSGLRDSLYRPRQLGLFDAQQTLDMNGQMTATLHIPDIPALQGATFSFAYLTVDNNKPLPYSVLDISRSERMTIGR